MAARLNPDRSFESACLHLFRYLSDERELRRNPLVKDWLLQVDGSADPIASRRALIDGLAQRLLSAADQCLRVESGTRSFTQRHYRIIRDHAIQRHEASKVACELGLSLRQFYRDRDHAYKEVVRTFLEAWRPPHAAASSLDSACVAMGQATFLIENAKYDMAYDVLVDVAAQSSDPDRTIEALCAAANVLRRQERGAQAQQLIAAARRVCSDDGDKPANLARVELAIAAYSETVNDLHTARLYLDKAVQRLRAHALNANDSSRQLLARVLFQVAKDQRVNGNTQRAAENLKTAISMVAAVRSPDPILRIEMLVSMADEISFRPRDRADEIMPLLSEALASAQQLGYAKPALEISMNMAFYEMFVQVNFEAARSAVENCVRSVSLVDDPRFAAEIWIDAAAAEIRMKDYARAEALLERAESLSEPCGVNGAALYMYRSEAQRHQGKYAEGLQAAKHAELIAERLGNQRMLSAVARELALNYAALGGRRLATETIRRAVELGERYANANSLAATYLASARLTGNPRHAQRARLMARSAL